MTFAELTAEEQAIVTDADVRIRAATRKRVQNWELLRAIADNDHAISLVASLDPGEVIPNTSGLAGSASLTRAELVSLRSKLELDRTANDDDVTRAEMGKAVGIDASVGG